VDLLSIRDLHLEISRQHATYRILRGVDLAVRSSGALGIVGESGSGKTLTCLSVLRLLPKGSTLSRGEILLDGTDLARLDERRLAAVRGRDVCMIFQDAQASLNPVVPIGEQIADIYAHRFGSSRADATAKAVEVLEEMGMPGARHRLQSYPHELSGGMCQRVLIAMALVCRPRLLIADEITTGLDVTIQTQVIDLIQKVAAELDAALVMISHDVGVIVEACRDIAVMYCGMVLEQGDVANVVESPLSPYSRALMDCFGLGNRTRMACIPGTAPDLRFVEPGCPFAPRCPRVMERCRGEVPRLRQVAPGRLVACHAVE
jgi:oligopeptide/dipeptide ABC transporter ATP-binding protein